MTVSQTEIKAFNVLLVAIIVLPVAFLLGFVIIRKYLIDLKGNSKHAIVRRIKYKQNKAEFEAQNSVGYRGLKHVAFDDYAIIVDNIRYGVGKALYDNCNNGDEVIFFYAPVSNFHLGIKLKEKYN